MNVESILKLLSGIALFLFGMSLMGDSLKLVAGNKLEMILYKLTGSPIKGFIFGSGITFVIQSSSATSVMTVGFVNSGMMKVRQAIPVVLGAVFGTSITGWVICLSSLNGASGILSLFSTNTITCVAAIVGVVLRMFSKKRFNNHLGNVLLGFSVLMFGMSTMSGAVSPLRESQAFISILTTFSNPIVGILVGLLFTSVIQSASAAVGILQVLTVTGTITFDIALPLIMGISIGAAVPVLLTAVGATREGKTTAFAYLVSNVIGVVIAAVIYYGLDIVIDFGFNNVLMNMVTVAALNSVYRFIVVIILLPLYKQIEKVSALFVPSKTKGVKDNFELMPMEERFINHPTLAIEQSRNAVKDMAEKVKEGLFLAFSLLNNYSHEKYDRIQAIEDVVDKYEDKIGAYLIKITSNELDFDQTEDIGEYLHTITDFERMSDHAVNLAESSKELNDKKLVFSEQARYELSVIGDAVEEIVTSAITAFTYKDLAVATKIEALEEVIDNLCAEIKHNHIERLQNGKCNIAAGFVLNDILTDYERIADHCSNIAIAIISIFADDFDPHEYINSLKQMKLETFIHHMDEYSMKYKLNGDRTA